MSITKSMPEKDLMSADHRIKVGVSSCLLGEKVRYDGGHKRHSYTADTLKPYFNFVSICPEVECGLPIPRESIHLWGDPTAPLLLTVRSNHDLTSQMQLWCDTQIQNLKQQGLRGYIFKKSSPSCGLFRVKVYQEKGPPATTGSGLFARTLAKTFPLLPLEEEGRLADARLRENFIERIFAYDRLLTFLEEKPSKGDLIRFHTCQKLLLMAHSPDHYRRMGKLVADTVQPAEQLPVYASLFMEALTMLATPAKQTNVLMHCLGYFKKQLEAWEKQELLELIERYRTGQLPLIVPVTLLKHYIRRFNQPYLAEQRYFSPHPDELMLRNHS